MKGQYSWIYEGICNEGTKKPQNDKLVQIFAVAGEIVTYVNGDS